MTKAEDADGVKKSPAHHGLLLVRSFNFPEIGPALSSHLEHAHCDLHAAPERARLKEDG